MNATEQFDPKTVANAFANRSVVSLLVAMFDADNSLPKLKLDDGECLHTIGIENLEILIGLLEKKKRNVAVINRKGNDLVLAFDIMHNAMIAYLKRETLTPCSKDILPELKRFTDL